jgi:diaminohydroxyphosphoribosylaminopyrimidine deaminase/5-amino-6-(5-phosphoribosylamino)uracil reductase
VSGKGFDRLRSAGVAVEVGLCETMARRLNEPFIKRVTTGLPWVICKWAQTIDGRIASRTGDSRWVSGEASRLAVHRLRARVDAIIVGIGTALVDDPMLTARNVRVRRVARRIVVDPRLRLSVNSQLVRTARIDGAVTVLTCQDAITSRNDVATQLREAGVEVVVLPVWEQGRDGRALSLRAWLAQQCSERSVQNVLVEGGAGLIGSLLSQGLVDRALVHVSPKVLGDDRAIGAVRGFDRPRMDEATALELVRVKRRGGDVELDYRVKSGS